MKKEIQILGIGPRKAGISEKTKQPYDFTEVCILYDDPRFQGQHAETVGIDQPILADTPVKIGEVYQAEMFSVNYKTRISCIYG